MFVGLAPLSSRPGASVVQPAPQRVCVQAPQTNSHPTALGRSRWAAAQPVQTRRFHSRSVPSVWTPPRAAADTAGKERVPAPLNTAAFQGLLSVSEDSQIDLVRAAFVVAQLLDADADVDVDEYLGRVEAYALRALAELDGNADAPVLKRIKAINKVLFDEEGFTGDINILDPRNSLMHRVMDRRAGIPISLSLLYYAVASRLGLELEALNLPGLVVTGLLRPVDPELDFFIDPFRRGDVIFQQDCEERLSEAYGYKLKLGEALKSRGQVPWRRRFVGRLLQTLKTAYLEQSNVAHTFSAVQMILCVTPGAPAEIRDRGFCHFFEGRLPDARADLAAYLERLPLAEDAETVRKIIAQIDGRRD
eukprot:tig00000144_g9176.t1